ncbi:MAG: hypothetical protein ABI691_03035 [Ginsengibacter sp.]
MKPSEIFERAIRKEYPMGIYDPHLDDPGFILYTWLEKQIKNFLDRSLSNLNVGNLHFYLIKGININAVKFSKDHHNFIGITKGLVDYSSFIFRNILRSSSFMPEIFDESSAENPIVIEFDQFLNWREFCEQNKLDYNTLIISSADNKRRIISEALFSYFIFFVLLHEIGHLNQRNKEFIYEIDDDTDDKSSDILSQQVLEMDADKYAIHELGKHLMDAFENKTSISATNLIFFETKVTTIRYLIFVILITFYIFSANKNFEKYTLKFKHPHPSLRSNYCIDTLLEFLTKNYFINDGKRLLIIKDSVKNFRSAMLNIFPNSHLKEFYELVIDKDKYLFNHYMILLDAAKQMKKLNGNYIPNSI